MIETLLLEQLPYAQSFALLVAVSGICVCAGVLLAARLLSRRGEPLRYGVLLSGVIALLAVPALVGLGQFVPTAWLWPAPRADEQVVTVSAEMLPDLLHGRASEPFEGPANDETFSYSLLGPGVAAALVIAWAFGVAIGFCRLARALWKQRQIILGQRWNPSFWTEELRAQLADKLGLRDFPEVRLSPAAPMPMVVGLWRPTIVLPQQAPRAWIQSQWEAVLLHEAAHIARRDHWAALVQRLVVILFWWCPLTHILSRRLNDLREKICDDCALEGPCDRVTYAELLLETAERMLSLKTVPIPLGLLDSARGGLEARITRLLAQEKRPMTKVSRSGKFLGGAVLVGACLLTTAGTAVSLGQSPAPSQRKVQIKIVVDGKEIDLNEAGILEIIERQRKEAPDRFSGVLRLENLTERPGISRDVEGTAFAQAAPVLRQADPRVDELVRQAEAIKPGSGEAIRRALQGDAKPADRVIYERRVEKFPGGPTPAIHGYGTGAAPKASEPPPAQYRAVESTGGKKIVILVVEDGKVRQLSDDEVKKLWDKGAHTIVVETKKSVKADPKPVPMHAVPVPARIVDTKAVPAATPSDIESLRRQLERLSHELNELRSRLDARKK